MQRLRRTLLRLALASLSIAAGLGVAEAWARATAVDVSRLPPTSLPLCRPLQDATGLRYELVPAQRSYQQLTPWADRAARQITYSVNPQGFRGRPVIQPKPADEFRVVVVGDSFAFGSIADDPETFPAQLERLLVERAGGRPLRVVNLGVPGYQIRQERATLERRTLPFEPDLVLLNLYVNDPIPTAPTYDGRAEDVDAGEIGPELRWIERLGLMGGQWQQGADVPTQQRVVAWLRGHSVLADRVAHELYRRLSMRGNMRRHVRRWREESGGYRKVLDTIAYGRDLAREHGFAFHVSMYPMLTSLADYPLADAHTRLGAECEALGVPFHDFLPLLAPHAPSSLWAHEQDQHPNGFCHGLVAKHLADAFAPLLTQ